MSTDTKALFLRVTNQEMRTLDLRAAEQMRSRANYVALAISKVIRGEAAAPSVFPEAAPGAESVVLFCRVPVEFKDECAFRAKQAGVPLSRWLRGVLFG